jgi:tetratricopeptide (TPR) repeat protein
MKRYVTRRRCYPALMAVLALAISGCATAYGQGRAALQQGRYAEAASSFEKALKEHPDRMDALVGLGIARYEQRAFDDAVAHLGRAVAQNPKLADAQLYLGLSYLERGDGGPAEEHLRAFRDLTQSARVARQIDDALRLMSTEQPLSPESRHFIATSLESTVKSEQELQEARRYYGSYYHPFGWGPGAWGPRCFSTGPGRSACF